MEDLWRCAEASSGGGDSRSVSLEDEITSWGRLVARTEFVRRFSADCRLLLFTSHTSGRRSQEVSEAAVVTAAETRRTGRGKWL